MKTLRIATILLLAACSGGGGGGTGGGAGGGGGSTEPKCPYSTAKTGGGSCQANYHCDDGGEPAVYCLGTSDGGADCECQLNGVKTPLNAPDLCTKDSAGIVAGTRAVCGWSL